MTVNQTSNRQSELQRVSGCWEGDSGAEGEWTGELEAERISASRLSRNATVIKAGGISVVYTLVLHK